MDKKYLELIALAPTVIRLIGTVSKMTGMNTTIPKLTNIVADTIESVNIPAAIEELQELKSLIELMVAETREPTDAEWATFQRRSDMAHEAIQAVDLAED